MLCIEATRCWNFGKVDRVIESGRRAVASSQKAGDAWNLALSQSALGFGLVVSGQHAEAEKTARDGEQLAKRIGNDGAAANSGAVLMQVAAMHRGSIDETMAIARDIVETYGRAGPYSFVGLVWHSMCVFWKGDWDEANREAEAAFDPSLPIAWREWTRGWTFVPRAYAGDREWVQDFRQQSATLFSKGRTPFCGDIAFTLASVEALAVIGERDEAGALSRVLSDVLKDGVVLMANAPVESAAGIASACGREWDTAEAHFENAVRQADELPHKIGQPETRRWYAWMLLERNAPGDRDKAQSLLNAAIEMYRELGMPKHRELAESMLHT